MTENEIKKLISSGESKKLDFKRKINLDSAKGKAEFIKDVVSIANSSPTKGYILIGVEDDGIICGYKKLHEERIQQILSTYINPVILVNCHDVNITTQNGVSIGVIEIQATEKPHKIVRKIEHIDQNDVFVRHGSVVTKASPEEIIKMHESSSLENDRKYYIESAKTHTKLDNYEDAIKAYTKAIEIKPSAELLLERAKLYIKITDKMRMQKCREDRNSEEKEILEQNNLLGIKDLEGAIKISDSLNLEKEARLSKFYLEIHLESSDWWDFNNSNWLKENTEGKEYAKTIKKIDTSDNKQEIIESKVVEEENSVEISTQQENSNIKTNLIIRDVPTVFFHQRICDSFPGVEFYKWIEDPYSSIERLSILLKPPIHFDHSEGYGTTFQPIWWFRGLKASRIEKFERIDSTHCLIDRYLLNIKRIAVVRSGSYYQDFVYIETNQDEPIGLYEHQENLESSENKVGALREEYGLFNNIPITRQEYDDGASEINGQVVNTQEAELRVRYLTPYNFIISSQFSPYNSNEFCRYSEEYFDNLLLGKVEFSDFIKFMSKIQKNAYDY